MNRRQIIAAAIVQLLLPLSARGLDFDFAKIADSNTIIPGTGSTFTSLNSQGPAIDGYQVAFRGHNSAITFDGVYLSTGGVLAKIADSATPIPGGTGNFTAGGIDFSDVSIRAGQVAFIGAGSSSQNGIYTGTALALTRVADKTTPIPGGSGNFTGGFTSQVGGGATVAFAGFGSGTQAGVYTNSAGLVRIVDTSTAIPGGGGNFKSFVSPGIDTNGNVSFSTYGSGAVREGVYSDVGGLHTVADTVTPVPAGGGNFFFFNQPVISGGNVAFLGQGTGSALSYGIYDDVGGLHAVADGHIQVPGRTGNFAVFGGLSMDGSAVVFSGSDSFAHGDLITDYGGALSAVVTGGATFLDGKLSTAVNISNHSFNGGNIAFSATLSDGSSAVYVAEQNYAYASNASGAWDAAASWSFGLKPRAVVPTMIHPNNGVVITGPASATTIRSLDLGAVSSGQAELRLQASGQLTVNEYLYVETLGKLNLNGGVVTAAFGAYNYGEIDLGSGGQINGGFFQNLGTLHGSGTVGNYVYNLATIQANNATQHYTDQVFNNAQVQIINSQVQIDGLTSNQFSPSDGVFGRIDVRNSLVAFNGGLNNMGSLNFSFGTSDVFGHIDNGLLPPADPVGKIIVSGNSNVTFYDAVVHNGSLFHVSPGSTAIFFGPVSGAGAFDGGGTKIFEGGYSPGNSPAAVSLEGPVQFAATNTLKIELGGTTPGTQYDKVQIAGSLSLDGTLQVALINSFTPVRGNKFDILDWTTHTGTFLAMQLPALVSPLRWNIGQLYVDGTLSVVDSTRLPGDFNRDTEVTGADIPTMLQALTDLPGYEFQYNVSDSDLVVIGDFDGSGAFTNADMQGLFYLLSHGGIVLGSPSPAAPVPEPATFILLAIALPIAGFAVRRRADVHR